MDEKIFRKKSLDRIKSPEELNDYVRVANPSLWILLAAIIILLMGACVWGQFGRLESKVSTYLSVQNGDCVCVVEEDKIGKIEIGDIVRVNMTEGEVVAVDPMTRTVKVKIDLTDGSYAALIVTESVAPFSFIFN